MIEERAKDTRIFNVYWFHHHCRCWPTSIQCLPVNCAADCLYDTNDVVLPTQFRFNVSIATYCWFNADKSSNTLAQHYSNTGSAVYLAAAPRQTRAIHPILFQCWPNVFDAGTTLKQHWVIVPCFPYQLTLPCRWHFFLPLPGKPLPR